MIVRPSLDYVRLARHVGPYLAVLLAYDVLVTMLYVVVGWRWISVSDLPLPLMGSAIALVVMLRNTVAYNRWWEARGLWGAVVNNSRNFARGLLTLVDDPLSQTRLVRQQIAYALALRCHLLRQPPWDAISPYLPPGIEAGLREAVNVPTAIQNAIGGELATVRRDERVDSVRVVELNRTLSELANAQGGLERIRNTPLPRQYNQFPRIFTGVYCLLLPIALVGDLGYYTPLGSTVIGFMFLALDQVGRDLEDPFASTLHDIPMQAISRSIEIDLLQAIGSGPVPAPIAPVNGVLW